MKFARSLAIAALAGATLAGTGCSVIRGQSTPGAYIDDSAITAAVKARMIKDSTVDAGAIDIQTLNGTVALSGFAKSAAEKAQAEKIARETNGVKSVRNNLEIRPPTQK